MSTTEELAEPAERVPDVPRHRRGIAAAAVLLLAIGGFGAYRMLGSEGPAAPGHGAPARTVAAADVTYEVLGEGTADISYRGPDDDRATVVTNATLPWKKTVSVPVGAAPIVHVTLGEKGGTASCTLAVRGRHIQRATATGAFGRTTCGGETSAAPAAAEGAR
ncbi:MmpS family transport accessory protein [Streptomyces vietnamensis]|uniref:MmpS family transport accessory protein n=1 Tax=Streptomyces vietnamensis TaxID=362257 RepID=UPI00342FD164